MSEWVTYTGDNPPTDATKHVVWECLNGRIVGYPASATNADNRIPAHGQRYQYIDASTPPTPEMPERIFAWKTHQDPNYGRWAEVNLGDVTAPQADYIHEDIVERDYASKDEWWRYKCALGKARSSLDGRPSNADAIRIINEGLHETLRVAQHWGESGTELKEIEGDPDSV